MKCDAGTHLMPFALWNCLARAQRGLKSRCTLDKLIFTLLAHSKIHDSSDQSVSNSPPRGAISLFEPCNEFPFPGLSFGTFRSDFASYFGLQQLRTLGWTLQNCWFSAHNFLSEANYIWPKCLKCHQILFLHKTCDAGTHLMPFALWNYIARIQRGAEIKVYPTEIDFPTHGSPQNP